jgi:hypothetical protein
MNEYIPPAIKRALNYANSLAESRKKLREKKEVSDQLPEVTEDPKTKNINVHSTWAALISLGNQIPPPTFIKQANATKSSAKNNRYALGHEILNTAMAKAVDALSGETGWSKNALSEILYNKLKENLVAKKSALSTIRFFRDANSDLLEDEEE